jgi:putative oxidoreductase
MNRTLRPAKPDVAGWIWRGLIAVLFVYIGWGKFDDAPNGEWVKIFARIGLGQWFRVFTGIVEIGGGVLYVFPRTNVLGAALLASAMIGAMVVHIAVLHDPILIVAPLALLAAVVVVAVRDPGLDLIARRSNRGR